MTRTKKTLKAKTFIRVDVEIGEDGEWLIYESKDSFDGWPVDMMSCEEGCLCIDSLPVDSPFYFRLIDRFYNSSCGSASYNPNRGFYDVTLQAKPIPHLPHILGPWFPTSIPEHDFSEDNLVLTSDGVIEIQKGQLLGNADGEISSIQPNDLLSMISKGKTKNSPSFQQVRLSNSKSRPTRAPVGTLIYNNKTDQLEFRGKNGWVKINTEDLK